MTAVKSKRLPTDLSKEDWIKAGFKALTKSGPQGVKIEPLAKSLKISRGSFYWHFKTAKSLKTAMIDHWVQVGTDDVIALATQKGHSPIAKLAAIGERLAGALSDTDYHGILSETAIRDWARYDQDVNKAVKSVTKRRVAYVTSIMEDLGFQPPDATIHANLLYGAMIGLEFLNTMKVASMEAELKTLIRLYLESLPSPAKDKSNEA